MEGHRGGQRAWWYRPDDINVASRTGYINIMLTPSFLRKTCPNGRNCCVRTRTGYGPCLPGLAFSRVNDLSGEGFSSSSLALEFWKGGDPLLSRESVSRFIRGCSCVAQLPFQTRRDLVVRAASRRLDEPDTQGEALESFHRLISFAIIWPATNFTPFSFFSLSLCIYIYICIAKL